ncbi:immunity 53 family protein [Winogradskyella bathintestinalis]|uniref:Immunity 53 family protein n=1 Tax=Winogradskyella bathintestinalis TaxID=3035208 RepID=A0ABT7ZUK5_9FLAO|nr:immunity 53 family protein [Winogradskyella bathintestinalis]MDN3492690.1 immunity 53 family protein [Winogradskyella bathintestinalis]
MEILEWIQHWFKENADGEWEKGDAIQITTLDDPLGWDVEIDISNTSIANLDIKWILNENGKQDWYGVKIQNKRFRAAGDAKKLTFLLGLFREMIEKIENE